MILGFDCCYRQFVLLNIYSLINVYLKISLMEDLPFSELTLIEPFRAFFQIKSKIDRTQTSYLVLFPENYEKLQRFLFFYT